MQKTPRNSALFSVAHANFHAIGEIAVKIAIHCRNMNRFADD
jgi:hypothetical protein